MKLNEEWREYKDKYLVSNYGEIKTKSGSLVELTQTKGWIRFQNERVARIVYKLFVGSVTSSDHIKHKDNNSLNNSVFNLYLDKRSPKESGKTRISFEDFVIRAIEKHGDKYSYDRESYSSIGKKIKITCQKHGEFYQVGFDHCNGHGCHKCYSDSRKSWSQEQDDFLRQNYAELGPSDCALKLSKSKSACLSRAVTLGIAKKSKNTHHEYIPAHLWNGLLTRARRSERGERAQIDFGIDFLWELYKKQEGKCALSGLEIVFNRKSVLNTVSVDRIDSRLGYTKENTQLVHKDVNRMKNYYGERYFYQICCAICNKRRDLIKTEIDWIWDEWLDMDKPVNKIVKVTNPLE